MKKIWYYCFMLGMIMSATAFVACGDDDEDVRPAGGQPGGNTPAAETSVVGYWKGLLPASDPEDMCYMYGHCLYYCFAADSTFKMMTSFINPDVALQTADNFIASAVSGTVGSQADAQNEPINELLYFSGTYSVHNDKLVLSITESAMYERNLKKWIKEGSSAGNPWVIETTYKLASGTLTLEAVDENQVHPGYHNTLVGKMDKTQTMQYPVIPDPDPIVGLWTLENPEEGRSSTFEFSVYGSCTFTETIPESGSIMYAGRSFNYTQVRTSQSGSFTINDDSSVTVNYASITTEYLNANGQRVGETSRVFYEEPNTETYPYSISGDKMTLAGNVWTKTR